MSDTRPIVLASTSPYRAALLQRLGLPFVTADPQVGESAAPGEAPESLALRLAEAKAQAVRGRHPQALIVGADQVAVLEGELLRKPGDHESAVRQLLRASGRRVLFVTALCLLDARSGRTQCEAIPYTVVFRRLARTQLEAYLRREKPYDCVGGFKAEGLGIALFERMEGDDPSALIGLPLMRLVTMLEREGVDVLLQPDPG